MTPTATLLHPASGGLTVNPNEADITFSVPVATVDSFTVHFVPGGGGPGTDFAGSFTVSAGNTHAEWDANPAQIPLPGTLTATVVVNTGTACAHTFQWSYTIPPD